MMKKAVYSTVISISKPAVNVALPTYSSLIAAATYVSGEASDIGFIQPGIWLTGMKIPLINISGSLMALDIIMTSAGVSVGTAENRTPRAENSSEAMKNKATSKSGLTSTVGSQQTEYLPLSDLEAYPIHRYGFAKPFIEPFRLYCIHPPHQETNVFVPPDTLLPISAGLLPSNLNFLYPWIRFFEHI